MTVQTLHSALNALAGVRGHELSIERHRCLEPLRITQMGQRFFKGSCKESSSDGTGGGRRNVVHGRKIRTGVPLSRPRPANRLRDYTQFSANSGSLYSSLAELTETVNGWFTRTPHAAIDSQRSAPCRAGRRSGDGLHRRGGCRISSTSIRALRPASHQQPSVLRRQLPAHERMSRGMNQ